MISSGSEDDDFIIRRASLLPSIVCESVDRDESGPVTPPLDHSLKLSRSLGLVMSPHSPPYRKVRSMNLMETPKALLLSRLEPPTFSSTPAQSPRGGLKTPRSLKVHRYRMKHDFKDKLNLSVDSIPPSHVNPFSPYSRISAESRQLKKSRIEKKDVNSEEEDQDTSSDSLQRPKISEFERPGTFVRDFHIRREIGSGDHGCVFECLHRLNGWTYAVKRSLRPVYNDRMARNEIDAHAALNHPHIVQSFSSWTENDYLYMQNEYCNGGNLEEHIKNNGPMEEKELLILLEQVAQGLRYIHSLGLAHMDIKPGNIFLNKGLKLLQNRSDHPDFKDDGTAEETVYKIGDLGHVIRQDCTHDVEEGDCRYLPREILNDTHPDFSKVDVFALGLTVYEAAGGGPLPKNGDEWHRIRDGNIKYFHNISSQFNRLIKRMIDSDPSKRLSAADILTEIFRDDAVKERHQRQLIKHQIDKFNKKRTTNNNNSNIVTSTTPDRFTRSTSRLIGKKTTKSLSSH